MRTKQKKVLVNLPPVVVAELDRLSELEQVTRTDLIREGCKLLLDNRERRKNVAIVGANKMELGKLIPLLDKIEANSGLLTY